MKLGNIKIEAVQGDIARQESITAIVNAANAQLQIGSGVAGAIHNAAGRGLSEECTPLAPIKPGEAVITGGHNLPNEYVIHVLGPVYGTDKPEDRILSDCYRNALELAEEREIESIAFPAISTGAFGYPFGDATDVALGTIKAVAPTLNHIKLIRFVLFSDSDLTVYKNKMKILSS
ncbi:macro domain-containing protein [Marivirga sp. S37H4]|uniref:Macro domain-containing protein n=1 Tax=Marivirga aurantiaca TaxID=2802615 RepID=A0A934WZF3_9BACT|nr:macro domain-containing protein [Marivirga aurantiaca]MBK6266043.1 macro domain-containing protein [Marivirga aurantiaca]